MKRQKLSNWGWDKVALIACTSITIALTGQIVRAGTSEQHLMQIPLTPFVIGESEESQIIPITSIQLNSTETGIEIILQTPVGSAQNYSLSTYRRKITSSSIFLTLS
ncbi:MAG: hypothetical protein HC763_05835 [Hydrococcus sp. CRU_1_1]|nr:hypothetical protein [Hydrococcus sp. CRU_1_1]